MKNLTVYLQADANGLHPISKKIVTTARALGVQAGYETRGILFSTKLTPKVESQLTSSGLNRVTVLEHPGYDAFIPEQQISALVENWDPETEIFLVPATPEGRTLSSMLAARLKTGVTADCTELSFTEDGLLLQTRPAFSGNMMASIVTKHTRPQIASLRFSTEVEETVEKTEIIRRNGPEFVPYSEIQPEFSTNPETKFIYRTQWLDRTGDSSGAEKFHVVVAVGGGLRDKADLELFRTLAEKLGADLCCSRALVDRGWMPRKAQIGLSGHSVSPDLLIAFGISGSVQFRAGLEQVGKLCAVNSDPDAPLMKLADLPLAGDLYEVAKSILERLD